MEQMGKVLSKQTEMETEMRKNPERCNECLYEHPSHAQNVVVIKVVDLEVKLKDVVVDVR